MFDKDAQLLSEAYSNMLSEKALTPDQIANNAQEGGSAGAKGEALPKNKEEDKETIKTLEKVPYTDQHADNFNQDGVDTKVKDRYTLKEDDEASAVADFYGTKKVLKEEDSTPPGASPAKPGVQITDIKQAFTRTPEQKEAFKSLFLETETSFIEALEQIDSDLKAIGGDLITPGLRNEVAQMLAGHILSWKRGTLKKAVPTAVVPPTEGTPPPATPPTQA